ncbi:unnamed protein product [Pleuronectes platessa]|uniref:Uncharacterized protein n=1 Tax=Pleuronectes platessa TaxID=8262 RepID=A0A9N7VXS8_PLEPL|nr:unnamed protein product [Pleuronectes platessa]
MHLWLFALSCHREETGPGACRPVQEADWEREQDGFLSSVQRLQHDLPAGHRDPQTAGMDLCAAVALDWPHIEMASH